jgi:cobalt/nickel transport system ATP-binding protein
MNNELAPCLFDVESAAYSYDNFHALEDVSFQVKKGERIALLGANGSGKSTLLRLLAALIFVSRGRVSCLGQELTPHTLEKAEFFYRFRRLIGIVFQNPDMQLFNASVFDEVAFGPLQLGWPKSEIRERVAAALSAMGIESLSERPPYRLSSGEKKRVALASVLITDPEVLLLDEPVAALDPASQDRIIELLSSWANRPRTVITATHDLDALETIADRCIVLQNGSVAAQGDPYSVLHDVRLLERTGLIRLQRHHHAAQSTKPHGHLHLDDLT